MRHLILTLAVLALVPMVLASGVFAGEEAGAQDRDVWTKKLDSVGEDAQAAFALALQLESKGYDDLAQKAYEIVIGIDPEHRAARRALGYEKIRDEWRVGDDLRRAKGLIHHDGAWITSEVFAEATRPQREAAEQKAGEEAVMNLLALIATEEPEYVSKARREMALVDKRFKLAPLAKALRAQPASLRIYAAGELGRLADPLAAPALFKRAIYDPDEEVRQAVVVALRAIDSPSTVHPFGRALDSRFEQVRVRAAEALGQLGDEAALGYIIKKWEGRSGDFPRSYFSTVRQISYIQDFDVEVAQTSFIADPIVGVLQEGVVQDVKIHATEQVFSTIEKTAYKGALAELAGVDMGDDIAAWSKFWRQNHRRLMDEREQRYVNKAVAERKASR